MYKRQDDQTAVQYFEAAWGLANVLAESNDHARAIVAQVGAERDQVVLQRDGVAAAYSDYQTAVIEMDLGHPEAGRHLKLVHSAAHTEGFAEGFADGNESGFEDGLEAAVEGHDAEYELVSNITGALEIDEDDASVFAAIILGNYGRMLPVTFYQKVGEAIKTLVAEAIALKMPPDVRERCDTLVLDPPRTGMASSLEPFVHDGVKTIIYVSCSPVAFTKDVQCLKQSFTLRSVQPIDMFPHTRHIEFVAVFSRS